MKKLKNKRHSQKPPPGKNVGGIRPPQSDFAITDYR